MHRHFPPPLDTLADDEVALLAPFVTPCQFPAGSQILEGGVVGDSCYFIDEGLVRVEMADEQHIDDDPVLDFVEPGSILGEQSLLDRQPRSAHAFAHKDVLARRLDSSAIDALMLSHPAIAARVLAALGRSTSLKLRRQAARLDTLLREPRDPLVDTMIEHALDGPTGPSTVAGGARRCAAARLGAGGRGTGAGVRSCHRNETRIGNVRDKTVKNTIASLGVYQSLAGQPGQGPISVDEARKITYVAGPVGVVFGLIPVTNPVATFIFKTLVCLKARNAVILSPSRIAQQASNQVGHCIRAVLQDHAAPVELVQWIAARNSRKLTTAFMRHPKIGMILATGGPALVKAAYSSGNPAIGVGSGNTPTLICRDADIPHTVASILASKTFDNGLICGAEHNLVVVDAIREPLIAALEQHGAAVLTPDEVARFHASAVDPVKLRLVGRNTGRSAAEIAETLGITRNQPIKLLVVPTAGVSPNNPLAYEKMMPILSLFSVRDEDEGVQVSKALLGIDGMGHTAIIHSHDTALIHRFGAEMPASRVLVNSPGVHGVIGGTTGLMPSFTLGCGTYGGTSTTDNVTFTHLQNIKHLAYFNPRPELLAFAE